MTTYELFIGGIQYYPMSITTTRIHPNPEPDSWSAFLPDHVTLTDEVEIEIRRDGTTLFKGILEERNQEFNAEKGRIMLVGGRHTKVKVWRNWIERNEDPKSGGFWQNYYPHDIIQFYLYPSKSDITAYHRAGWGIDPLDDWVITTNPAGSSPKRVKDRFITLGWDSGANQANGHYIRIDLGSAKTICAIRVENRINDDYAYQYNIKYSTTGAWAGEEVTVATETANAANNIVHAWTPVSARYWEIILTGAADPTKEWTVGEIYLYETDGTMTGIAEGTLTAHAKLDESTDFTWMRRTDAIQKITDLTTTGAGVKWEWWVTDDGVVYFDERRGSDKSASVSFNYRVDLVNSSFKYDSKGKVERLMVLGKGSGNAQDVDASSGWVGTGEYEKVVVEKDLVDVTACTQKANVLLSELNTPITTIRCEVEDIYPTGSWGVGDDITLVGVTGIYRVTKIIRNWSDAGEKVTIEASNHVHYRGDVTRDLATLMKYANEEYMRSQRHNLVPFDETDDSFLPDMFIHRPTFIDEFKWWNTTLWTEAGVNSVTPDVQTVDSFPCLRIRTGALIGDSTQIYTGSSWSGATWRYQTKAKFTGTLANYQWWFGMASVAIPIQDSITFLWNGVNVFVRTRVGGVSTLTTISNAPSLLDWHLYRIDWISGSEVNFYIDDLLVATHTTNIPAVAIPYQFYVITSVATAQTFYVRGVVGQEGRVR